jgi:hypothetical protein
MTLPMADLPNLGQHRDSLLYVQSPAEACLVRQLSARLRRARQAAALGRRQLAAVLGVDPALLVAVENGYGSPVLARELVEAAERLGLHPTAPKIDAS